MMVRKISVGRRIAKSVTKSHSPRGREVGDEALADDVRLRGDPVDRVGGEPAADQLAVLAVLWRVDLGRHESVDRVRLPRGDGLAGEDLRVLIHLAHLLVPREDPVALCVGVEERGAGLAQLVGLLPVAADLQWRGGIEVDHRASAGHPSRDLQSGRRLPDRSWSSRPRFLACRAMPARLEHRIKLSSVQFPDTVAPLSAPRKEPDGLRRPPAVCHATPALVACLTFP